MKSWLLYYNYLVPLFLFYFFYLFELYVLLVITAVILYGLIVLDNILIRKVSDIQKELLDLYRRKENEDEYSTGRNG